MYTRKESRSVTIRDPKDEPASVPVKPAVPAPEPKRKTPLPEEKSKTDEVIINSSDSAEPSPKGIYTNWSVKHGELAAQSWCCIGDLMAFCDRYEFKSISHTDARTHSRIVAEVKSLLSGAAPFDVRKRFPGNIRNPENLWVCIDRCAGVEYHLNRILSAFRKPLDKLSADKQRAARQNFHLAVNELRLDISARILDIRLYDRMVFERDFRLEWQDTVE